MNNEIYCDRERLTCEAAGPVVSDCYKTARKYGALIKSRRQLAAVFMLWLETWGQPAVLMFSNDGLLMSRLLRVCVCVWVSECACVWMRQKRGNINSQEIFRIVPPPHPLVTLWSRESCRREHSTCQNLRESPVRTCIGFLSVAWLLCTPNHESKVGNSPLKISASTVTEEE